MVLNKRFWQNWNIIIVLSLIKLLIHLITNTNYNFHRDEYLYLALGNYLSWGFMEIPPFIAIIAKIVHIFGANLFITRLFPALIGSITVFLLGVMVRDLGGKKWAQALACIAFILSPGFLRSNTLFQPVSFNQFWWFLSAFFIVKLIKFENVKYWYILGLVAGVGLLTKYSITFFYLGFLIALLFTPSRKWLKTKYPYVAAGIAMMIFFPNLLWQYFHNFPIVSHMTELSQTQLVNVKIVGFLIDQFLSHHIVSIVWLLGLIFLFSSDRLKKYRVLAWIYLITVLFLIIFSGKSYYSMGAYAMLFAAGGIVLESFLEKKSEYVKYVVIFLMVTVTIPIIPYGLPILKIEKMKQYCAFMKDNFFISSPLYWEDGKIYSLPQDFADMHGWEELAQKVSKFYHNLPVDERKSCMIHGGGYSHASALLYYKKKYNLPEVFSFNGSFIIWAPDSINFNSQILVDDVFHTESSWFDNMELVDQIQNPNARDPGYIYYRTNPKIDVKKRWSEEVKENKSRYNF